MASRAAAVVAAAAGGSVTSPSSAGGVKDRKKSAHWTDNDTSELLNVLLRYNGDRTIDNGFRAEVWEEASAILDSSVNMGGAKTPEACKSRWQRLQRDYKAVRDLEELNGFTWDRNEHRLKASEATWEAAEEIHADAKKARKIHLPCYNQLAALCPDNAKAGGKGLPKRSAKPRVSSTSFTSDSSGVVSLNLTPSGQNGMVTLMQDPQEHARAMASGAAAAGLQPGLALQGDSTLMWPEEDNVEHVETAFSLSNAARQTFMTQQQQKRMPTYETNVMTGTSQHPSPKRRRPSDMGAPLYQHMPLDRPQPQIMPQQVTPQASESRQTQHQQPQQHVQQVTPQQHQQHQHQQHPQQQQQHQQQHQQHQHQQHNHMSQATQPQPAQQPPPPLSQTQTFQQPPHTPSQQTHASLSASAPTHQSPVTTRHAQQQHFGTFPQQTPYDQRSPQYTPSLPEQPLRSPVYQPQQVSDLSQQQPETTLNHNAIGIENGGRRMSSPTSHTSVGPGHTRLRSAANLTQMNIVSPGRLLSPTTMVTPQQRPLRSNPSLDGMSIDPSATALMNSVTSGADTSMESSTPMTSAPTSNSTAELVLAERHTEALRILQREKALTPEEMLDMVQKFEDHPRSVDSYLALEGPLRTAYVKSTISKNKKWARP